MMTFAGRYCTCELQLQFCVYMYYCAFKPICGLGLVNSVLVLRAMVLVIVL